MYDIPSWLPAMDSMKYLLTDGGTLAVYMGVGAATMSQIFVVLYGVYKVREMFLNSSE